MNLLEKLEAEQAAGWPSPEEPDGPSRRRLQQLLTILAAAVFTDRQLQRHWPEARRDRVDNPVDRR